MRLYELAVKNAHGDIISRGGIKAGRSVVYGWKKYNEQNCPWMFEDGERLSVVVADDDAITEEEFLSGKN